MTILYPTALALSRGGAVVPAIPRTDLLRYRLEPWNTFTASGEPIRLWKASPMPRIDDGLLECVVYLYQSEEHADQGRKAGGCGFWVTVPGRVQPFLHPYIVTNSHVVNPAGNCRVIRVNKLDGGFEIIETKAKGWIHHKHGDDVAIYKIDPTKDWQYRGIPDDIFISHDLINELNIGPGDEAIILGRFLSHDGTRTNTPALRFGNIAMMPLEPVLRQDGLMQESFLVESRSLSGASGSPVFVRIPFEIAGRPGVEKQEKMGVWFLGLNWGHLNLIDRDFERVRNKSGELLPVGWKVRVNTGMMGVVPAWKVMELLNQDEVQDLRDEDELQTRELWATREYENMVGQLDVSDEKNAKCERITRRIPRGAVKERGSTTDRILRRASNPSCPTEQQQRLSLVPAAFQVIASPFVLFRPSALPADRGRRRPDSFRTPHPPWLHP